MIFLSQNLKYLREKQGLTQGQLADMIGVKANTVSNYEKGNSSPDFNILNKIIKILDIDAQSFLYENIQTKIPENRDNVNVPADVPVNVPKPKLQKIGTNEAVKIITIDTDDCAVIPIVDISAAASPGGALNPDYVLEQDVIKLPPKMVRRNAIHHCIVLRGQSMAPTMHDGSYLINRLLDRSEWCDVKDQYVYVITNNEGATFVKRVKNRLKEHGFIVCMSDNPDKNAFPNFNITEDELVNIWEVEFYISSKMPNIHNTYYDKVQRLEDDMDEVKNLLAQYFKKPKKL